MSKCTANSDGIHTSSDSPVLGRIGAEDTSTQLNSNLIFCENKTAPDLAQGNDLKNFPFQTQLSTNP